MVVKRLWIIALLLLAACGANIQTPARIALLAPFEGRYREIGYNALHPARLAFNDASVTHLELYAVDDGGSVETARLRAEALIRDPLVKAVIVLGYDASDPSVQAVFDDLPVVVVGNWMVQRASDHVFILSNPAIELSYSERLDVIPATEIDAPYTGGDVFMLEGFRTIRDDFDGLTVISSGILPDENFHARIMESDQFAVEPNILAPLTYDAFRDDGLDAVRFLAYPGFTEDSDGFITVDLLAGNYGFEIISSESADNVIASIDAIDYVPGRNYFVTVIDDDANFTLSYSEME